MKPVLPGAPWLIAHKSMLGINKPNKITLNGKDYVIWQNAKGEVFALDNICPHMQAPLSNGWVCKERNTIACPFHALEFDTKGRLYQDEKFNIQSLAEPLELKMIGTQFQYPFLKSLLKKSLLKAIDTIVEQDTTAVENLYPRQNPKIKLPNEEIMFYAEQLYQQW
ncbi:Rieske (2Fe-2S) protein [Mastigocoleus testarum]|uniref:Rieske domain-containing protein n=1 Tax=Mastigocoleus testarum BC008 TaxID=371196 RepID=A0A0V7ZMY6_9CYAN|nr:Rieske (2Fe-2S) protein [Mastigocoleus testarum]KST65767.1 hypothetical protein BC008_22590 [Mastigocoleus testarum BC008]